MTVYSDMPGVQLYTFNGTSGLKNKDGSDMIPHGALCLETQFYPGFRAPRELPVPLCHAGETVRIQNNL